MKKTKKIICALMTVLTVMIYLGTSPVEAQAAPSFNLSPSKIAGGLNGYSIAVTIDGEPQRFIVKKNQITKFTVKSKKYSLDKKSVVVKGVVYIDRTVAVVKSDVTMKYRLVSNKWKVSSVQFTKTSLSDIKLKGTWKGTYTANQGETRAKFVINKVSKDGYAAGTFYFSATPTNPSVPSGSYTVKGGYDKKTGKVSLIGDKWVDNPANWSFVDFYCHVDLENKQIVGNNKLVIKKSN